MAAYNAGRMNLDAIKRGLQSLQDTAASREGFEARLLYRDYEVGFSSSAHVSSA